MRNIRVRSVRRPTHRQAPTRADEGLAHDLTRMFPNPRIRNDRQDMLAANHLARALYAPLLADPRRPANIARFIYLDPAA
ncbi:hypothetical protein [Streptomyces sp. NPDC052036]|uniref:MmyB family transcriptional regulator n=1 Tax=Streptomyces sp. NPDC052036 TaxID=3155171 RepID=UPI0034230F5B